MLPTILSTKYGRYKTNQDDVATFLAVTGSLCGAPASLSKSGVEPCRDIKSARLKGKDRKLAKQRAADEPVRQRAPRLALSSYVPLAEVIAKSPSVHGRVPKWLVTVIDKIISDRQDCFRHINGEDVGTFVEKGRQDGHIHPISVLERVRAILVPKYEQQLARMPRGVPPKTPDKRALGEVSGNANATSAVNMFAELRTETHPPAYSTSIMKMAHLYNACSKHGLIKAGWFDMEHCMKELQGANLFMCGKMPGKETEHGFGAAFLFAAGAMSLTYTAPDCRDRKGRRRQNLAGEPPRPRKNGQRKMLQKLGPVSLMFEDRFCRAGDRYELNEDDLQAITERVSAYKAGGKGENSAAHSNKPRFNAAKAKPVAQLLADLCLGLDQEVPLVSFPYVCLNLECATILLNIDKQLQSTSPEWLDVEDTPVGFGLLALHLMAWHSDKLWMAADSIHRWVRISQIPGRSDGCTGAAWMMDSLREPMGADILEEIHESMRERSSKLQCHMGIAADPAWGGLGSRQAAAQCLRKSEP